jgi:hypothetical protein
MPKFIVLICDQPACLQTLAGRSIVIFPTNAASTYDSPAEAQSESEKYPLNPLKVTFAELFKDGTWKVVSNKPK